MKNFLSALGLSLLIVLNANAQSAAQCARALDEAEQAFEQGRLLYILDKTANRKFYDCLENGNYSIDEEIRARKLLVKTYLFSDNEEEAERELIGLLITDKEHPLTPEDPAELYFLYSKFQTEPIIRLSGKLGGNKTYITQIQEFNTGGTKQYNPAFGNGLNLWAEILAERHLGKGFEIAAGPQFRFARYDVEGNVNGEGLPYEVGNISSMLRLPVLARYNFWYDAKTDENERKKLVPYVFAGASFDLVLNARYEDTSRSGGTPVTLADESSSLSDLDQVAKHNWSIFGGAGIRLRVGRAQVNFLALELRYDNTLFNYINPDTRWDNQEVFIEVGHLEDDLTINTLSLSFGYTHSLYLPRKRKQFR
ncbi:MAG: outer membrane beta-barrel protein [Bacteroidota bacterium]